MTKVSKKRPARPAARAPARPRGRAQQKLDTHERIRAAAWELFNSVGYEETTTKAVAERAGVASGTVFVHARDKADLLFMVMHERLDHVVEAQLATLPKQDLLEQLMHLFGGIFAMYGAHPSVAAPFVRAVAEPNKGPNGQKVDAFTFSFLQRVAGLVQQAQQRGEVSREVLPLLAAQNFFALYFFALLVWIGGYATIELALDPGLRAALALQLRGLAP